MKSLIKTLSVCLLVTAILLSFSGEAAAVGVITDREGIYEKAVGIEFRLASSAEEYATLADTFEALGDYSESGNYALYCRGMAALLISDSLDASGDTGMAAVQMTEAEKNFYLPSIAAFLDSEEYYRYCLARETEYRGFFASAEEQYAVMPRFRDSLERKGKMNDILAGRLSIVPAKTPVPLPDVRTGIPARATQTLTMYAGPGKEFAREKSIKVNAETEGLFIIGKADTYYLMETETGGKKLRFWANSIRITYTGGIIPECGVKMKEPEIMTETSAYYGPGEDYAQYGFTVPAGIRTEAYETEGAYTMIRVQPASADKPVMAWVLSSSLSY